MCEQNANTMRHLKGIDFSSSFINRKMGFMHKELLVRFVKYAAMLLPFILIFYTRFEQVRYNTEVVLSLNNIFNCFRKYDIMLY